MNDRIRKIDKSWAQEIRIDYYLGEIVVGQIVFFDYRKDTGLPYAAYCWLPTGYGGTLVNYVEKVSKGEKVLEEYIDKWIEKAGLS